MGIPVTREQLDEWERKGLIPALAPAPLAVAELPPSGPVGRSVGRERPTPTARKRPTGPLAGGSARVQLVVWIPGLTVRSEPNIGGKRRSQIARKLAVKAVVEAALPAVLLPFALPTPVVMTRVGSRKLDDDNLEAAFKFVRDTIARWLNVDDGDTSAVRWKCRQRPGYKAGVEIRIG